MANIATKPTMSAVLASKGIAELGSSMSLTPEQLANAKGAAMALSSNPNLKECDPFSLVKFCFETARYNFTRDDCMYPVPYKDKNSGTTKVQAQLGFKGIRELVYRTGLYKIVDASIVYKGDKVVRNRETGDIKVEFNENVEDLSDEVIGYYAYAIDADGKLAASTYMTKKQMEEHRAKYSKSATGPWSSEFNKMAMKTVIKRLCGKLPSSPLISMAIKQDQVVYGGKNEKDEYLDNPGSHQTERTAVTAPAIPMQETEFAEKEEPKDIEPKDFFDNNGVQEDDDNNPF